MSRQNQKPIFIKGPLTRRVYDGITNDLLTAGLGKELIGSPALKNLMPDAVNFSGEEQRRLSIYNNYKGLIDPAPGGGYGIFYGPGAGEKSDGKIGGKEYLAYADDGTGKMNVVMMVQIPVTFDPENPCIVAAPSSGSRGIYGGLPTVGEWALKRGFAVAYTDKGTGVGVHDLDSGTVFLMNGKTEHKDAARCESTFTADVDGHFIEQYPHRIAVKHTHSKQNRQRDWGKFVLMALRFAFYVLNLEENFGRRRPNGETTSTILPESTIVIASGISNGGDASIRAAEQDTDGLIDGVVVSEPNLQPVPAPSLIIRQGDKEWKYPAHGRHLLDYCTLLNIYQPCANLDPSIKDAAPFNLVEKILCENRIESLTRKGLLSPGTIEERAVQAQKIINDYGILEEQNLLQPAHYFIGVVEGIAVSYANAYGCFGVEDRLCGFSFAATDPGKKPTASTPAQRAALFARFPGIPPSPDIDIINDLSKDGPVSNRYSVSRDGCPDMNLDGALALRRAVTGIDEKGNAVKGESLEQYQRIKHGISEILASGDLNGCPAIIVHGRNDALLPPNHTSRPYYGLNNIVEGKRSRLHYYEVENAHHLDFFNEYPGFDSRYIPLQYYFHQALDLLYDHLKNETPIPPSQLVRTTPRGHDERNIAPPITQGHIPPIDKNPKPENMILFSDETTLFIPE